MARNSEERSLQITSKSWLDWSLPDVLAFHPANEMYIGKDREAAIIQMSLLKKQGFLPGLSDWFLFWSEDLMQRYGVPRIIQIGAVIELKIGSGKLSDSQIAFRNRWVATGGLHAICRSMEEIESTVKSWGLKPKYPVPLANVESKRQMRQFASFDAFKPL